MAAVDSVAQCVALRVPEQLPVFCHSERFDAAYCHLPYLRYSSDAATLVDCQVHTIRRFGWDWSWVHVDDAIELEPFGVLTSPEADDPRHIVTHLPLDRRVLNSLQPSEALSGERIGVLLESLSRLRAIFGDTKCICGRLSGPLTLLALLFGPAAVESARQEGLPLLREAIEFALEVDLLLLEAQAAAGAHALWIDDRLACSDVLSPEEYESLLLAPTQRLLNAARTEEVWGFYHTAENDLDALALHAQAAPDVLSLGPSLPMAQAQAALGRRVALMGNLDPTILLTRAWPSQVAAYVDGLVRHMKSGGMILATAGPVPADARGPNLHTVVDTARKIWDIVGGR